LILRPYQEDTVKSVQRHFERGDAVPSLLVLPTGTGKSLIVSEIAIIAREKGLKVLVLHHTSTLLVQNYDKYTNVYGGKAVKFSASLGIKETGDVIFATTKSVKNSIDLFDSNLVICVDECHIGAKYNNDLGKIIKKLKPRFTLGLTATPVVLESHPEGSELVFQTYIRGGIFKNVLHLLQIQDTLQYWSELKHLVSKVDLSLLKSNSTGQNYTEKSIDAFYATNDILPRISRAVNHLKGLGVKRIVIFCENIEYATLVQSSIKGSAIIHSKMKAKDVENSISGFKLGVYTCLINVNMYGVGVDYPELDGMIDASPTQSAALYYQRVGRLVRQHKDKSVAYYADLSGNYSRFGDIRNIKYEIRNNSWCMTNGEKDFTKKIKKISTNYFDYSGYILKFGKHKGKTIGHLLGKYKHYLVFINSDKFEPSGKDGIELKNIVSKLFN
jgi:DNA repair protein RadD